MDFYFQFMFSYSSDTTLKIEQKKHFSYNILVSYTIVSYIFCIVLFFSVFYFFLNLFIYCSVVLLIFKNNTTFFGRSKIKDKQNKTKNTILIQNRAELFAREHNSFAS